MNEKIIQLREQIAAEERKIANCKHLFGDAYYNPETLREPYGYKTVGQGSDVWMEPQGYRDVKKDRWSRKCQHCGFVQHTYQQEPVISTYRPKF